MHYDQPTMAAKLCLSISNNYLASAKHHGKKYWDTEKMALEKMAPFCIFLMIFSNMS